MENSGGGGRGWVRGRWRGGGGKERGEGQDDSKFIDHWLIGKDGGEKSEREEGGGGGGGGGQCRVLSANTLIGKQ